MREKRRKKQVIGIGVFEVFLISGVVVAIGLLMIQNYSLVSKLQEATSQKQTIAVEWLQEGMKWQEEIDLWTTVFVLTDRLEYLERLETLRDNIQNASKFEDLLMYKSQLDSLIKEASEENNGQSPHLLSFF